MLVDHPERLLAWLTLALLLDAVLGDPPWLWRRLPHPVVLIGRAITRLERLLLDEAAPPARKRRLGALLVALMVAGAFGLGLAVHLIAAGIPHGWLVEALLGGVMLAQRSLHDHVLAVARGMDQGIEAACRAVSMIVGRDPERLDSPAVGRAAIESAAENFSDGVIAPLVWALLLGLPGLLAYKAINTMDSMIGHKSPRYLEFGRAAARLDDRVNLPASRLSAVLVMLGALLLPGAAPGAAWRTVRRDARLHRSPNAGWPEAAFAGALGIRLCGPRSYGGVPSVAHWIGSGRAEVTAGDVRRSLVLLWLAWAVAAGAVGAGWWVLAAGS
ncbi:adenosylcobinamide-phosphate synthase CbiB [Geminicoccus roseus]|uniref:adenosylcobinamide-phosphate synthase CbiB n=1 Tax=Geminicoccus roseus TaxID=404900 RepID=UPI00041FA388|nr:adenosylcobinamide-phosphate synthase CbiB [Geminicoccus roseus]